MSTAMPISQYPGHGYPTSGVSPGVSPMSQSAPEDSAYIHPTDGLVPFRSSTSSAPERTLSEYDSGVLDLDGVKLTDRQSYNSEGQRSPSRPFPPGTVGYGNTPQLGSKAHPHPAVTQALNQPGAMKRPDSLARGHEYEELPITRYQDPTAYSYAKTDASGGRPHPPAIDRLALANGSNSGTSGDSRELLCDTNHNDRLPSPYRKRENPLYDSADSARQPSLEGKTKLSICSCPFILIIFFAIVATLAFILAALAMSGINQDSPRTAALVTPNSQLKEALERLQVLEGQYTALQNKYEALQQTVGELGFNSSLASIISDNTNSINQIMESDKIQTDNMTNISIEISDLGNKTLNNARDISSLQTDVKAVKGEIITLGNEQNTQGSSIDQLNSKTTAIENKVKSLEDTDVNVLKSNISSQSQKILELEQTVAVYKTTLQNQYLALNANFSSRLDMISKMPGPPGAGNLTLCQHKKLSVGESSSKESTLTKYVPDTEKIANDWVITGVECAVSGGELATMQTEVKWNTNRFRCQCYGNTSGDVRHCELHYWRCPRIS